MPRLLTLLSVLLSALLLAACGSNDEKAAASKATATPAATPSVTPAPAGAEGGCTKVAAPKPKPDGKLSAPKLKLDPAKAYTATVTTSCGVFKIALDVKQAPKTSASFVSLAKQKFFDATIFHRIVAGFVIQGGDPTGTGTGGPGYSVKEAPPAGIKYTKGVVAMAKTGAEPAGTSGSQFYVVTGDDAQLPPDYALLGKVTEGLDVVETIGAVATGPDEKPTSPVVIDSVAIAEA
jgi:peptidyl-prolyl cis-trans isomerase B (cyclophilin B)